MNSRNSVRHTAGFTLIELLVVIAIIGILIALLLPAVQKVRAAASRTECANKLKQIGIAIHSFHDTRRRFPPGCAGDQAPFGKGQTGSNYGSSWMLFIMPYIELDAIYSKWDFSGGSGYNNNANLLVIKDYPIKAYKCPSCTLQMYGPYDKSVSGAAGSGSSSGMMNADYTAIAGAINGVITGWTETRIKTDTYGQTSGGGVLTGNSKTLMDGITDGTSNTMIVSEVGAELFDSSGSRLTVEGTYPTGRDYRSSSNYGFQIGASGSETPTASSSTYYYNVNTIRYQINQVNGWTASLQNANGVGSDLASNTPLRSNHGGGVNALFADGSLRFLTDGTPLDTLGRMATRDDGKTGDVP